MASTINSKGQVTIPKAMRARLDVKPGSRVKFFAHPDGGVVLLLTLPASALRGIVAPRDRPLTIEEMTEATAVGAVDGAGLG
jgi:antitoxin PrlF